MENGFIKVAALSPQISLADCEKNAQIAAEAVIEACELGADVVVFPEMFLSGSTCGDLLLNNTMLDAAQRALDSFLESTAGTSAICFIGIPSVVRGKLCSSVAVCRGGELMDITYNGENQVYECVSVQGLTLGAVVGDAPDVAAALCRKGATVIANLTATSETIGSSLRVRRNAALDSERLCCAVIRANAGLGESTTDNVFSGQCLVAECGEIIAEKVAFDDPAKALITELDLERIAAARMRSNMELDLPGDNPIFILADRETELTRIYDPLPFIPKDVAELDTALEIQARALARRIGCTYSKKLVLGISGGLDSTLAILVAVRAAELAGLSASDVIGITMPCFGTTKRTRSNAELLCLELGVDFRCINIAAAVNQHLSDIGHNGDPAGVAFENSQARERTQILMDLANMVGGLVVGTGDLSELALGWATYNGDHMSMYSVNADIPKTLVRRIVDRYASICGNEKLAAVLRDILDTPVSPELLPAKDGEIAQKTEELLGPYEVHDFLLYHTMKYGYSPKKLFRILLHTYGDQFSRDELKAWLTNFTRRFITQQFKRSCSPDGPKVCEVCLSPRGGWRAPSDASAAAWLREIETI